MISLRQLCQDECPPAAPLAIPLTILTLGYKNGLASLDYWKDKSPELLCVVRVEEFLNGIYRYLKNVRMRTEQANPQVFMTGISSSSILTISLWREFGPDTVMGNSGAASQKSGTSSFRKFLVVYFCAQL